MSLDTLRDERNREAMRLYGLDALVCRLPENVLLLTGYWAMSGFAFAVFPLDGPSWLIVVDTERSEVSELAADEIRTYPFGTISAPSPYESIERLLREAIRSAGLERGRIGYEANFEVVSPGMWAGEVRVPAAETQAVITRAAPDANLEDGTDAINWARAEKTPSEIVKIRRANKIASFGLAAFAEMFEPGRTEAEVAAEVEAAIMRQGMGFEGTEHARGWAQLMSGPDSWRAYSAHPVTSTRIVEEGDLGVLELGAVADGYWSDLTRTLVAGRGPDQRQQEMYDALLVATAIVLEKAEPGMTGAQIDSLARTEIDRRGYGELFVHHLGHGLGFRYHEPYPLLNPSNDEIVTEWMVSSVEPGLYLEGVGGMRLEEDVVFTESGVELLSDFPRGLSSISS